MGLMSNRTRWFFILPSSTEAEERHMYDIAFGIKVLLSKNVLYQNIVVIIDRFSQAKIEGVFSKLEVKLPSEIFDTTKIDDLLVNNTYKNAVVFITGHGSPKGLDSIQPIKPYNLYKKFQVTENFKRVIFYFGQCYAGIFNYMPLSTHLGLTDNRKCNIIAVGGTGLFPSISSSLTYRDVTWSANIFLAYVFQWLSVNEDIDGDDRLSVMDSFKSAAINTNEALKEIKKGDNFQSLIEHSKLRDCIERLHSKDKYKTSNTISTANQQRSGCLNTERMQLYA